MDDNSWAELARLAREAKAELETENPTAVLDISACEDVVALAEGAALRDEWATAASSRLGRCRGRWYCDCCAQSTEQASFAAR